MQTRRAHALLITIVLAAVTACSSATGSSPTKVSAARLADDALDRALAALVARDGGPPGIAVVVQRGDTPVLHAAGSTTPDTATPIELDDHVRIASAAKAYSGATALALVASGELALDDTIGTRLPTQPAAWHDVTLAQLLHHTSGIPDFSAAPAFQEAVRASLTVAPPPEELLTYVADQPLEFQPGSEYRYSNSDNIAVALMVQAATDEPYETALSREVLGPTELTETSLPSGTAMPEPVAPGYDLDPPAPPEDVTTVIAAGWSWASGGVVSTPADSNRFVRAYAAGTLTSPAARAAQRTFRAGTSEPPGPGTNAAGLAIFRYTTRCGTAFGHTGNTLGYTHFIAASGDGNRSVSVSVNAQITPKVNAPLFPALRRVFGLAVCAALAE